MAQQPIMPPQDANGANGQYGGGFNAAQPTMPYGDGQQNMQDSSVQSFNQPQPQKPKKKKRFGCLIVLLVIVLLAIAASVANCVKDAPKNIDWPTTGLATMLPEPPNDKGQIISNSDTYFSASVEKCTADDYSNYVAACSERGFNVEAESDTNSYTAFNSEGYELSLTYWESSEEISISLDAPEEMGEISWPPAGPAALVPAPASTIGSISTDSSTSFFAYVGQTSQEDFKAYADACSAAGFTVDYNSGETWYRAKNAVGDSLSLSYTGFNTMTVDIDLAAGASGDATVAASEPAQTEPASTTDASGVTPEFKATMDEYEAFFDEYVQFMKTYAESDNVIAMAADYADMMKQYTDTMEAMDSIDENSLSDADLAYYLEVQNRINTKLLEVSSY